MKQTVVLYPCLGFLGHLFPMMELADAFVNHGYDVTVVLLAPPVKSAAPDIDRIIAATTNRSISFHVLQPIPAAATINSCDPFVLMLEHQRRSNNRLESFLRSISPRQRLHSLVIDFLNGDAIDVAAKLNIPVYTFFSSGAAALAVLASLPTLCANSQTGLRELGDTPLEFAGVPSMPASHLIAEALKHPEHEGRKASIRVWKRLLDTRGLLVNTVESLERRAVQALSDPIYVPGRVMPPVYCVGPLIAKSAMRNRGEKAAGRPECLTWLDAQPECSVVFLCFGSMGVFSEKKLREIAVGLEESRQRFLWVVRNPASGRTFDLDVLLPEGFLARTNARGLVVKSWAPQVDVLRHRATGAFVTHCGWNSTLEALMAGVPMLCWPLYAEQKMNKVVMTSSDQGDMGIGVEMDGYDVGFVKAEEVAAKLRLVMESGQGKALRARVAAHRKEAEAALEEGGAWHAAFRRFLMDSQTNLGGAKQLQSNL